jgi:hypothetical protein
MLRGYDIDGVLTTGIQPIPPAVAISGRVFAGYDDFAKRIAQFFPVYIRGVGYMDAVSAGEFKAMIINHLGVEEFHEDDPVQEAVIKQKCPKCVVVMHPNSIHGKKK